MTTESLESAYDAAVAQLAPRLHVAKELAKERSAEMMRAARGRTAPQPQRRWPTALAGFGGGLACGMVAAFAVKRWLGPLPLEQAPAEMAASPDGEYVRTLPEMSDQRPNASASH